MPVWIALVAALAATDYFPPGMSLEQAACRSGRTERPNAQIEALLRGWYSRHLAAADEPPIYARAAPSDRAGGATLRFIWLRTFHRPIIVRVEGLGSAMPRLIAKQLSGAGGYEPGTIEKKIDRPLSASEADKLVKLLASTSVLEKPRPDCRMGLDGAEWLIEGVDEAGTTSSATGPRRMGPFAPQGWRCSI